MRFYPALVLFVLLALFSPYDPIQAQDTTTCPTFMQVALQKLGMYCADSPSGTACYGNPEIAVTYVDAADAPAFANPGDQIKLSLVSQIQTSAVNLETQKWGLALLRTQANLPRALNNKGVVMVALGDVRVGNAVSPADALLLADVPLAVVAGAGGTDLFDVPSNFKAASASFKHSPAGTTFQADGLSPDGKWVRVFDMHEQQYFNSANAWIKVSELSTTAAIKNLPTIGPDTLTPMQSIYLDTGLEQAACATDPASMLYLQGPEETEVQLKINGADIQFGSTILVRILSPGNTMQMIVLSGVGILNRGAADQRVVTPAYASQICLSAPSDKGIRTIGANCRWSTPTLLPNGVLQALYTALDHKIPQSLQYYPTYVPQLMCPSGIGQAQCHIMLLYEKLKQYISHLCQIHVLPKRICDRYLWNGF